MYSKGLAKVSAKVFKAAKESNGGTVSNAWHFVAEDMEATADTHKSIASLLVEEIVKPLKMFAEAQHRTRKSVESLLEKGRSSMEPLLDGYAFQLKSYHQIFLFHHLTSFDPARPVEIQILTRFHLEEIRFLHLYQFLFH